MIPPMPWWLMVLASAAILFGVFVYLFLLATAKYHDRLARRIGADGRPKTNILTVTVPILWMGKMHGPDGEDFEVWVIGEHGEHLLVMTDDLQIWRVVRGVVTRIEE